MTNDELLKKVSRELADQGKIIEAGWFGLKLTLNPEVSDVQIKEMRMAFFAGAQHLFASLMTIMEPGAEPTEKDMDRMNEIDVELKAFVAELNKRFEARN